MQIQFFFVETSITLTERNRLKQYIEQLFKHYKKDLMSLNLIFCTDNYLLEINKQFLEHDYFTDIITFNLSEDVNTIEGEIYISIDRVRENALTNQKSLKSELHRVIFHGVLHLCGFKDKSLAEKNKMTSLEDANLISYFQ